MPHSKPGTITPYLLAGALGVVGLWVGGRLMERLLEKMGTTIEQVAMATGTAIGQGVQVSYAPMDEPAHYRMPDAEGEAWEGRAYDPTYDLLPDDVGDDRIALIRPGESLLPPGAE